MSRIRFAGGTAAVAGRSLKSDGPSTFSRKVPWATKGWEVPDGTVRGGRSFGVPPREANKGGLGTDRRWWIGRYSGDGDSAWYW